MKIIDKTSGKRVDKATVAAMAETRKTDPVRRQAEKELELEEHSPMDPPEAYSIPQGLADITVDKLADGLKRFTEEHDDAQSQFTAFEEALKQLRANGFKLDEALNDVFSSFFQYFDDSFLPHNRREERYLFPILHARLIASGEHSKTPPYSTAVDLFEDDHVKFIQLAALCYNFLGLGVRLQDRIAQLQVMDAAYNSGLELVELMKLHVFREDHTLFPLAQKLLSPEELAMLETHS